MVLCGKKIMQWHEKFHRYETKEQKNAEMEKYLKKIIANAYLGGNVEHENLSKMVIIPASLKDNIGYQTYTLKGTCLEL